MEKNHILIIIVGAIICAGLFFIDLYLGATGAIILVAIGLSLYIMDDAKVLPEISVRLGEDAKRVIVSNRGTSAAYKIHVAIVPLNIEFDVKSLEVDEKSEHPLVEMINEAKAAVEFEDSNGSRYNRTFSLSALGKNDDDLLKPMFPIFKWKE